MRLVVAAWMLACACHPAISWAQEAEGSQSAPAVALEPEVDRDAGQPASAGRVAAAPNVGFIATFNQVPRDFVRFASLDTLKTLAIGATSATIAHRWDEPGSVRAQRHLNPDMFRGGNVGGNFYVQTGTALGMLSIATMAGSAPFQRLGSDLLRAQILTQGVVQAGKLATRRAS